MPRPNLLIIMTDQHRHDCVGYAGNSQVLTPHLDALAADGEVFSHSFCPYPVCTPSRYSFLTGAYARQHLGLTNHSTPRPDLPTWPRLLRAAGYDTAAVGKMHSTPTYLDVGFGRLRLAEQDGPGRMDDDYHRELLAAGLMDVEDIVDQRREFRRDAPSDYWDTFGAKVSSLPEAWHSTTWIGDQAVAELDRWSPDGPPRALMVSFIKPHHPFDPTASWLARYDADRLDPLPGWTPEVDPRLTAVSRGYFPNDQLTEPALRRVMAHYYATLSHVDEQIGRLVGALRRKGLYDGTLILFTSDHGEFLGSHHLLLKGNLMLDPLVRVPLLLKWPGSHRAGSRRDGPVSLLDLPPTLLEACGVEAPATMPGLRLSSPNVSREVVIAEDARRVMVRSRSHKLLLSPQPAECALFDLAADPLERRDLYHEPGAAAVKAELTAAALDWGLFDSRPVAWTDDLAPRIDQPNAQDSDPARREAVLAEMAKRVTGLRGGGG